MAAAYYVTLPIEGGQSTRSGVNAVVVYAESASQAKEAAAALNDGDSAWTNATATAIAAPSHPYSGWTVRIRLYDPTKDPTDPAAVPVDVSVVCDDTTDTIDEIGAALVTALNATTPIAGAAYNSTTQVLKIAETTDNLGNYQARVEFTHPNFAQPIASLVSSITDGGSAGSAVTATFLADSVVPPTLYGKATQR